MNKQPILYLQTDARWKNKPYRTAGENSTIGSAGCGPTCAAMLIETLTGKTFTPEDACKWSMERGYRALNQGTYYSYFKPQFAAFGSECGMLNWTASGHFIVVWWADGKIRITTPPARKTAVSTETRTRSAARLNTIGGWTQENLIIQRMRLTWTDRTGVKGTDTRNGERGHRRGKPYL